MESVSINKLIAELDAQEMMINTAESKLQKQYNEAPDPTNVSVSRVNKAYEDIKTAGVEAGKVFVKLQVAMKSSTGFDEEKKLVTDKWNIMSDEVANKLAVAEEYVAKYCSAAQVEDKVSMSAAATGQTQQAGGSGTTVQPKNTLERLPLPTFDGTKKNYLRFKKEFSNHVTYTTDKERMLALKTRCLLKSVDKNRVENEMTLKDCWDRLDEEYGDIDTLVADIFLSWQNLKPPKTDQDFTKFVTAIENGVSCLKSLGHEKELEFSYMAVTLENKLNERMKNEFSIEYTSDESRDKERMKSLLKYLVKQKKAAQLRSCNYKSQNTKPKEEDISEEIKSSYAGHGRGGGRYRGRGGRGRGQRQEGGGAQSDADLQDTGYKSRGGSNKGRGGYRGRGGKRGETSKTCLVCDKDHLTSKCDTWRSKTTSKLELNGLAFNLPKRICTWCLEPGHTSYDCSFDGKIGCPCGSNFNIYICVKTPDCKTRKNWTSETPPKDGDSTKTGSNSGYTRQVGHVAPNGVPIGKSLLPVQEVDTRTGHKLKTMFDSCSQSTFVSSSTAKRMDLKGVPIKYTLVCTDGREEPKIGKLYNLVLVDKERRQLHIQAIGIDKLSGTFSKVKVTGIEKCFDSQITNEDLAREKGNLDLLVGTDLAELHPVPVETKGKLVLLRSRFGSGWTLLGFNDEVIDSDGDTLDQSKVNFVNTKDIQFLDLVSMESVGVDVPRKCNGCKSCKECNISAQRMTYLESLEDKCIKDSIEYMPDKKRYKVSYPYTKEINQLLPNEDIAMKRAVQLEQKLVKSPVDLESANKILKDSFDRGVFRYLTDEELEAWTGPVHYLCMDRVYKESESTPCRLTFDSSQPDKNGLSLNGCLGKGRNPLNYFGGVVLNWRAAENVACGDISKMFNQCEVRDIDVHVRRFFVRPDGLGGKEPFKVAAITVVNFGEKPAGNIATAIKDKTAKDNESISPEVSKMIINECFMDDCFISAKYDEDIDVKTKKAEEIMEQGGFRFKNWTKNGQKGEKEIGKELSRALGVYWDTEKDKIVYKVRINFSRKVRNRRLKPDSSVNSIDADFPQKFTKRIALKIAHSVFDPASLVQPFILKLRLAYRNIIIQEKLKGKASWDEELQPAVRDAWVKLAKEMYQLEQISFDRSIVPPGYDDKEDPMLLLFSDGSDLGQCTAAYIRWVMKNGSVCTRLVTSRVKIASIKKVTTPMSELLAALISSRLKVWLATTLNIKLGKVIHLVDSSIVLGMVQSISLKFDTFTAPRVAEIQTNTGESTWYWLDSKDNPADIGTRGNVTPLDLDTGSKWQCGPEWLVKSFSDWPIREDFKKHDLPGLKKEFEVLNHFTNLSELVSFDNLVSKETSNNTETSATTSSSGNIKTSPEQSSVFDYKNYNCWNKLRRVVTCMLLWKEKCKEKEGLKSTPRTELMLKAKKLLLLQMMPETNLMLEKMKFKDLIITRDEDGLVYVSGRTASANYNPEKLVLLSPKHPCTRLILKAMHEVNHRGINYTVARSRIWYWIPQAAKIVKSIKNKCVQCRRLAASAMKQIMSPLPDLRLKPAPVWHFSMVDLAGPVTVKGFGNQRTSRKTWMVIITCLVSRAVMCYLAEDYSTDSLLLVLARHEARNGCPAVYYADLGSQIKGADRILSVIAEEISKLDKEKIQTWASDRSIEFRFGVPHFPEGQGAVERLIAEIKKELKFITKNRTFSFGQLETALAECSYLVNSRPLQINPGPGGEDGYVCPNDLMFGRSDKSPPIGPFESCSLARRLQFMRSVVMQFWDRWYTSYYQRLIKYQKWRNKSRNAKKGDIVLILDREAKKGQFTLGEIVSIKTDADNVVRKVMIRYKLKKAEDSSNYTPTADKFVERNVRGLALVLTAEERSEFKSEKFIMNPIEGTENIQDGKAEELFDDETVTNGEEVLKVAEEGISIPKRVKKLTEEASRFCQLITTCKKSNNELPPTAIGRKRWGSKR